MATTWLATDHPWFARPSMKRKSSAFHGLSSSSSATSSPNASRPIKRLRQDALEANFSSLSLRTVDSSKVAELAPCEAASHSDPVLLPSSEPSVPEVKMKTSSWYEPEPDRIIVTDLDSSSDEEEESDHPSFSISPVALRKISSRSRDLIQSAVSPQVPSQALVLFKPLPVAGITDITEKVDIDKKRSRDKHVVDDVVRSDEAMDVELW